MAGVLDFLEGFGGSLLKQDERRQEAEAERKKMEAMAAIQRETSDYEFKRNQAAKADEADDNQSGLDGEGNYVVRRADGSIKSTRAATEAEKVAYTGGIEGVALKNQLTKRQLDNIDVDNSRADRALDLQARGQDLSYRASMNRGNGGGGGKAPKVAAAAYNSLVSDLSKANVPPSLLMGVKDKFENGVASGWTMQQQATYLSKIRETYTKEVDLGNGKKEALIDRYADSATAAAKVFGK